MAKDMPSSNRGSEFLVILDPESAAQALDALSTQYRVTQLASPRVVVVESDPGQRPPSASLVGVLAVCDGPPDPEIVKTLGETEALFVAAWASRMTDAPKRRRGEGLSWDAPGFAPPDPPAGRPSAGLSL